MIVAVVGIDEERIGRNVTFASSFDTTIPSLASKQVAVSVVPENRVADVRL